MSDTITLSRKALSSLLSPFIGSYPDPDNPLPPGPWDPVIRRAFNQIRWAIGPQPDPWRSGPQPDSWITSTQNPLIQVALNPQPLPPRLTYTTVLAQEIINSIANLQDIADSIQDAQAPVSNLAIQRLQLFFDDYCGTPPRKSPFPGPRPRNEEVEGFNPLELIILGTQFESAATTFTNGELQQVLSALGSKLTEQGATQLGAVG